MKAYKYLLWHCPEKNDYKLEIVNHDLKTNRADPCLVWEFENGEDRVARRIMENLNIAHLLDI